MQAKLFHGTPIMVDHTPGSAVTGGSVVVIGNTPMVAHRDIAANVVGALAARHGIYRMIALEAMSPGTKVWWVAASGKVDDAGAATDKHFGIVLTTATADGDEVLVLHVPDGTTL